MTKFKTLAEQIVNKIEPEILNNYYPGCENDPEVIDKGYLVTLEKNGKILFINFHREPYSPYYKEVRKDTLMEFNIENVESFLNWLEKNNPPTYCEIKIKEFYNKLSNLCEKLKKGKKKYESKEWDIAFLEN